MECVVTGAAGFIGSHLCERLLRDGNRVLGIDCFTPYYPRRIKEQNLDRLREYRWFSFQELDLSEGELTSITRDIDWVFHLAAMPGLNKSWTHFELYQRHNIVGTQRLLEALKGTEVQKMIYASTSSVYGRYASGDESLPTRPCSPYGVTKLAGEQLARVYAEEYGLPVVTLRYFSVYGPGQRPDMGYHQFIDAIKLGRPITVFGDGRQVRGNTFVSDCVEATVLAATAESGEIFNVGGGELVTVLDVLEILQRQMGTRAQIVYHPPRPGDQRHTGADVTKLTRRLGWEPKVGVEEGLARQLAWQIDGAVKVAA